MGDFLRPFIFVAISAKKETIAKSAILAASIFYHRTAAFICNHFLKAFAIFKKSYTFFQKIHAHFKKEFSFSNRKCCFWDIAIRAFLRKVREGCTNENSEKVWSFAKLPSDPHPSGLAFFLPPFFLKIASIMAKTNFALGPTSKKINLLY